MEKFLQVSAEEYQECLTHPPKVADTRLGPIEYAVRGEGPVVLAVHGGPGGYDQGLALAECFRKNGFKVVAPSRPGYLGTPLGRLKSPEEQGEALAALIQSLDLGPVALVGASAGGPPTYSLAQFHPEMVAALIQIDSVSIKYTKGDELSALDEALYLSKAGVWVMDWMMKHFPSSMVKSFLKTESSLEGHELDERIAHVVQDPAKLSFVRVMTKTMCGEYDHRKAGLANDLEQLRDIDRLPMDNVTCPTLVMHGTAEGDVPGDHAEYAHGAIAGSELYWIQGGSHIGFWISDAAVAAQEYAVNWLCEQLPGHNVA